MKKAISLGLAAMMALSLTACGGSAEQTTSAAAGENTQTEAAGEPGQRRSVRRGPGCEGDQRGWRRERHHVREQH